MANMTLNQTTVGAKSTGGFADAGAPLTTGRLAELVRGRLDGPDHLMVRGANSLEDAQAGDVTFIRATRFGHGWAGSKATAALVSEGVRVTGHDAAARALIHVACADLAMIRVLDLLSPPVHSPGAGVDPSATVDATAVIGAGARIGVRCVVGPRSRLGAGVVVHANTVIGAEVEIGTGTTLYPNVVIYDRCTIGAGCTLHAGVVIGADGFGFHPAPDGRGLLKIPHIGTVRVGDGVEIGANSCIDRGKFGATTVGDGTKIDNLVQVGHNARIGRCVVLCGQVGIAGSVRIDDGAMLGGQVGVTDGVHIGAGAKLAAQSGVMGEVPAGAAYGGTPAHEHREWLRNAAVLRSLAPLLVPLRKLLKRERADGE